MSVRTLNSAYNEVTFNKKSAITKENIHTKYTPFTYKYVTLNEKPPITKQNLHIFVFIIGRVECICRQTCYSVHMLACIFAGIYIDTFIKVCVSMHVCCNIISIKCNNTNVADMIIYCMHIYKCAFSIF